VHLTPLQYAVVGAVLLLVGLGLPWVSPLRPTDLIPLLLYGTGGGFLLEALLRAFLPAGCESSPSQRRRYLRQTVPAMALYVVAVCLSVSWLKQVDNVALRALIALLPVPPIALLVRAMMRRIREADELQRRIEIEALAIATTCMSLGYLAAGLLQSAKVVDVRASAAMILVFPLICLAYAIAKVVLSRRYA